MVLDTNKRNISLMDSTPLLKAMVLCAQSPVNYKSLIKKLETAEFRVSFLIRECPRTKAFSHAQASLIATLRQKRAGEQHCSLGSSADYGEQYSRVRVVTNLHAKGEANTRKQ